MVVVVGAGATGLGVGWDLALRGIPVTVVDQGDVGHGTSGRFHGLLHSGGRYVVTDPPAARACAEENRIVRRVAAAAVEPTGGFFVQVGGEADSFRHAWLEGCRAAGIPTTPVDLARLRRMVPGLTSAVSAAYAVPDAVLEGFRLLQGLQAGIRAHGGAVMTHTRLTGVRVERGRVVAVELSGPDGVRVVPCAALVNAAGPWAGAVSHLYGDPLTLRLSGGLMILFADRRVPMVVNRLAPPGDGDIFVPHQAVTILGTTDVPQNVPEPPPITRQEVRTLLDKGRELFPDLASWRVLRAFTGVRPLYQPGPVRDPRVVSRDFTVIHHAEQGGPEGVVAIVGGKWTTFRLMAERTADVVARILDVATPGRTATVPIPIPEPVKPRADEPRLCECEGVTASMLAAAPGGLHERRVRTWFGMGPCQGTFCGHRAAIALWREDPARPWADDLAQFRRERDAGMAPVLLGANARQAALMRAVRGETLGEDVTWS